MRLLIFVSTFSLLFSFCTRPVDRKSQRSNFWDIPVASNFCEHPHIYCHYCLEFNSSDLTCEASLSPEEAPSKESYYIVYKQAGFLWGCVRNNVVLWEQVVKNSEGWKLEQLVSACQGPIPSFRSGDYVWEINGVDALLREELQLFDGSLDDSWSSTLEKINSECNGGDGLTKEGCFPIYLPHMSAVIETVDYPSINHALSLFYYAVALRDESYPSASAHEISTFLHKAADFYPQYGVFLNLLGHNSTEWQVKLKYFHAAYKKEEFFPVSGNYPVYRLQPLMDLYNLAISEEKPILALKTRKTLLQKLHMLREPFISWRGESSFRYWIHKLLEDRSSLMSSLNLTEQQEIGPEWLDNQTIDNIEERYTQEIEAMAIK